MKINKLVVILAGGRKGRIRPTASMAYTLHSALIGTFLGIALLLSTARVESFSVGNRNRNHHIHPNNPHSVHNNNNRHNSNTIGGIGDVTVTRTHADNTALHARLGRTKTDDSYSYSYSYSNSYSSHLDFKDKDEDKEKILLESVSSSRNSNDGWEGLNNECVLDYMSPSTFGLRLSCFVPNGVSASVFSTSSNSNKQPTNPSPLVLTPDRKNRNLNRNRVSSSSDSDSDSDSEFLRSFLQTNQKWVNEQVLEYGGIVFRGFGNDSSSAEMATIGKEIIRAFGPGSGINNSKEPLSSSSSSSSSSSLSSSSSFSSFGARKGFEYYLVSNDDSKTVPRSLVGRKRTIERSGTKPSHPVPRLAEINDRTRLTDWRGIHDDLPPNLRRKLEEKDLLYKRTHLVKAVPSEILLPFRSSSRAVDNDDTAVAGVTAVATKSSPWFRLFGSTNKKAFEKSYEKIVAAALKTCSVEESKFTCEAFRNHPQTNEKIWFEFAHRFHWTSFPAELLADFQRTKNPWTLARAVGEASIGLWKRLRWGVSAIPRSRRQQQEKPEASTTVAFGDGTPVSWWEMHQIRGAIKKNTVRYPWKPGDFLVVDGLSMGLQ